MEVRKPPCRRLTERRRAFPQIAWAWLDTAPDAGARLGLAWSLPTPPDRHRMPTQDITLPQPFPRPLSRTDHRPARSGHSEMADAGLHASLNLGILPPGALVVLTRGEAWTTDSWSNPAWVPRSRWQPAALNDSGSRRYMLLGSFAGRLSDTTRLMRVDGDMKGEAIRVKLSTQGIKY